MKITAITQQKKRKDRVSIYLDGVFSFGLDLETMMTHHLKVGMDLTDEDTARLLKMGEYALLYNKVLSLISRRPRTEKEVIDYLHKHEAGETLVSSMISRLKERKFLDDKAFITWYIDQRNTFRPKGKTALVAELRQKGISNDLIAASFIEEPIDEMSLAKVAVTKKLRQFARVPEDKRKEKIIGFLSRRGFSWNTVNYIVQNWDKVVQ